MIIQYGINSRIMHCKQREAEKTQDQLANVGSDIDGFVYEDKQLSWTEGAWRRRNDCDYSEPVTDHH